MSPEAIKAMEDEAGFPKGVAARVESEDLARVLVERAMLLRALQELLHSIDLSRAHVPVELVSRARSAVSRAQAP